MDRVTREVPVSEWSSFLDQFSRLHHGQKSAVVTLAPDTGLRPQARDLPLLGVTAEPSPGEGPSGPRLRIDVLAGDPHGPHVRHAIDHPSRVTVCEWNDGVSAELQIESQDGKTTRVLVGPAEQMLPPGLITDGLYQRD
jgi:hypothetical protein